MKIKKKYTSFLGFMGYIYIPTVILMLSYVFREDTDYVFIASFFSVITISSVASYYAINKSFEDILSTKILDQVIPLNFFLMLIFGILVHILLSL